MEPCQKPPPPPEQSDASYFFSAVTDSTNMLADFDWIGGEEGDTMCLPPENNSNNNNQSPSSSSAEDPPESSIASDGKQLDKEKPPSRSKKKQKRMKQPRFAFMTKSETDHLEDGYRWRKYGQKAVKNSPFPRSYYRCTNNNCSVKKRVERSSEDPTIVITTYEGQHCHHSIGTFHHHRQLSGMLSSNQKSTFATQFSLGNMSHFYYPIDQLPEENTLISSSVSDDAYCHSHNNDNYNGRCSITLADSSTPEELPTDDGLLGDILLPRQMRNG
ncbi:probable WRKY transcription factor 57 [Arachis stenosperma]|uniref:probable WRKY transcription factor 57 n=1 Tax=Arachis stenosperma TaxID=217475 RepID=UPI0025AD45CA|nr:probable WRKY transcription factor 57 [Arachis stenosperma]